jgi:hypothetical protein
MPGSTSNLSVDEQQATVAAKRKEGDVAAAAQSTTVAAERKTMNKAWVRERATALTWEKEKTIARHLEQQLATAQGITIP